MLGEEEYGLDIMDVNIIEKVIPTEPVAGFPKNLKGIIRLRGDVIPVYSLRRKFGMEDIPADENTRYIITDSNGIQIAYEVDSMIEIAQFEPDQQFEVPPVVNSADTSYIKTITKFRDKLVIILNHNGVLTEEEQNKIKTVIKK
jgi:purine-binding chemotaxis protein CheW